VTVAIAEDARLRAEADERLRVERLSINVDVLVDDALFDACRLDKAPQELAQSSLSSSATSSSSSSSSSASSSSDESATVVSGAPRQIWRGVQSAKFNQIKVCAVPNLKFASVSVSICLIRDCFFFLLYFRFKNAKLSLSFGN
jgi:hypothetical protein